MPAGRMRWRGSGDRVHLVTSDKPDIETLGTRIVYQSRWMRVREDRIRYRDGSESIYGVIEKPDFVVVAPVEEDGRIHLVEQYRYPVRGRYWEMPQGAWEGKPEADPLELGRGELREETGLEAAQMMHAGELFLSCGASSQRFNVFLATGLRRGAASPEPSEQDMVSRDFPLAEVERMIRDGEIKDAATVAAFGLLRLKGLL